jgi:hypothetical protein
MPRSPNVLLVSSPPLTICLRGYEKYFSLYITALISERKSLVWQPYAVMWSHFLSREFAASPHQKMRGFQEIMVLEHAQEPLF